MNQMLASALSLLNGLIALLIIAALSLTGWTWPGFGEAHGLGAAAGFIAGVIVAALACGTIAILALIEKHLRTLVAQRGAGAVTNDAGPVPARAKMVSAGRVEPTL